MSDKNTERMEKIVSLCKRRGFIFQAGEIYGGLNGCWDYGPLGTELKKNLKDYWWRRNVRMRDDIEGMDGAILTMEQVLVASGHVGGFSDPMCDCLLTKARLRADQVPAQDGTVVWFKGASLAEPAWNIERPFAVLVATGKDPIESHKTARKFYAEFMPDKKVSPKEMALVEDRREEVTGSTRFNPENGGLLTEPRQFNLMLQTNFGATGEQIAYLRPETAQSIFVQFKNVLETSRQKLPFGIAQIGKSFRNEINPRNFTFRSREFEQMEIEYFCAPEDGFRLTDEWLAERLSFYEAIGIPREKLHILDVPDGDRAFYSKKTYDIEYEFPFGIQELEGIAYRTDYDLGVHQKGSGKPLEYFEEETRRKFLAHVVEPSAGCDRTVLAMLCQAYDEETVTDEKGNSETRVVMRFVPRMAPIKAAVFPLLKKNEEQVKLAKEIIQSLRPHMNVFYDESGAVGRRYRRQDEAGTPFCITVDFESLGENDSALKGTVTVRHRDSMQQERLAVSELLPWLQSRIH